MTIDIHFDNSFSRLPEYFFHRVLPTRVADPKLIIYNHALAKDLGITGGESEADTAKIFSGNTLPTGADPIATVYAGHQFGGFSPQLGDGRAILLGEVLSAKLGIDTSADPDDFVDSSADRYDLQLKGSGPTPYSRSGDGRSALGPVLREYLVSEAMAKLGVPTTRALCAVTTGEQVARDTLVAGGILTRIAKGFVRVGSFEYFSSQGNQNAIKELADYEIARHYPQAVQAIKSDNPYPAFLACVIDNQAKLIARWMQLGFIHGVMNTDNMAITGETIDYGPCAFMDEFSHNRVFSSIDRNKRYSYANQPKIAQWNLIRLAETLLPLFVDESIEKDKQGEAAVEIAQSLLNNYEIQYKAYWLSGMRQKLGLSESQDNDTSLIENLLNCMESNQADFTLTFHYLSLLSTTDSEMKNDANQTTAYNKLRQLFTDPEALEAWLKDWRTRLALESSNDTERQALMQSVNPVYIPRNHQIESAIRAAEDNNDFSVFHDLHDVLQKPFEMQAGKERYMLPPLPEEVVHQTFCGT